MYVIEVGSPYNPSGISNPPTTWPETARLMLHHEGCELVLFLRHPVHEEISSVASGEMEFAWISRPHVGLLVFKIGAMPWMDAPFEIHRVIQNERSSDEQWNPYTALHVPLVDATTGIVRALRVVSWPPMFVKAIRDNITLQSSLPHNDAAAQQEIDMIYSHGKSVRLITMAGAVCRIPPKYSSN